MSKNLRSNLHTKALNELKRKYTTDFYVIYHDMLRENGLEPTSKTNSIVKMNEEIERLKKLVGES